MVDRHCQNDRTNLVRIGVLLTNEYSDLTYLLTNFYLLQTTNFPISGNKDHLTRTQPKREYLILYLVENSLFTSIDLLVQFHTKVVEAMSSSQ